MAGAGATGKVRQWTGTGAARATHGHARTFQRRRALADAPNSAGKACQIAATAATQVPAIRHGCGGYSRCMDTSRSAQGYLADPRNEHVLVWLNGTLVPRAQAVVSVFDSGFALGDGVWEGLRQVQGRLISLDAHLDRLFEGVLSRGLC